MTDGPQGMHDTPTHHSPSGVPHAPSHEPPAWYASPHNREPLHGAEVPSSSWTWGATQHPQPPTSRRGRSEMVWVIPVVGIACLVAAFSLVTMLLGRGGPDQSAPTLDQITRSASDTVSPSVSSSTGTPMTGTSTTAAPSRTSNQSASETSSVASAVAFPAGTSTQCKTFDGATTTLDDSDVQQTDKHTSSCDFLVDLRKSVWAHDGASPSDSTYALDVFSRVRLAKITGSDGMVHLQCAPAHGLVHCVSQQADVDAWVRSQRS